jgi:hypothetical protein
MNLRRLLTRQLVQIAYAETVVSPFLVEHGAEALPHCPPVGVRGPSAVVGHRRGLRELIRGDLGQPRLSGTVVAADTGQPPSAGACVYAYGDSDGSLVAATCIDVQTGAYTIEGLEAGVAYRIRVTSNAPYPFETWLPGGPTFNDAQAVVAPATVDVSLPLAGTLVGTLIYSDGSPAADESVVRVPRRPRGGVWSVHQDRLGRQLDDR